MEHAEYGPWIGWDGGECPFGEGVTAQVQLYSETRYSVEREDIANAYDFETFSSDSHHIIAYRYMLPPKPMWQLVTSYDQINSQTVEVAFAGDDPVAFREVE